MGCTDWTFESSKVQVRKKHIGTINIQATEGNIEDVILESMLTGRRVNVSIPGTTNAYTNYESQVNETYRKYNGLSDFGNAQTRAIVDIRASFITGDGISISAGKSSTANWIEDFLLFNKLKGVGLINTSKCLEMAGQTLFIFKAFHDDLETQIKTVRVPYRHNKQYKPVYGDLFESDKVKDVLFKNEFGWDSWARKDFVYIRTGGDDHNSQGPVTKIGVVLTDIENYDRATKDMRRNNHVFARITPVWETSTDAETVSLKNEINKIHWRIGQAVIGKAKFRYETPKNGAHENLISELVTTIKNISITGVPVHWLGYVDLMSNRATAQTLYEYIKVATSNERKILEESFYELILKAMELYVNSGGTRISYDKEFEVKLSLISLENFLEIVRGLSIALKDEALSVDDYRNFIPGIDPEKTKKVIEKEKKKEENAFIKMGIINSEKKDKEGITNE